MSDRDELLGDGGGDRLNVGENWARSILTLNEERDEEAEASLAIMPGVTSLEGKILLDIGSASGLPSLAARRLGARVRSFDFDR